LWQCLLLLAGTERDDLVVLEFVAQLLLQLPMRPRLRFQGFPKDCNTAGTPPKQKATAKNRGLLAIR
jgi:hypothetical protein